jgi:hypothetical protein
MVTNNMENKQTAVDFLLHELSEIIGIIAPDAFSASLMKVKYEQAKAMEKEQIKDAYLESSKQTCWSYGEEPPSDDNMYAEDYYNKTYFNAK